MNHEEKSKMTDYLIAITIIFIIVSIFAAIRANAQELGYRVVISNEKMTTDCIQTKIPKNVNDAYFKRFNKAFDVESELNLGTFFIEHRNNHIRFYVELLYIDKKGKYKHLNKKRIREIENNQK